MIAADFVKNVPFFGVVASAAQAVFVNRTNRQDKEYVLKKMLERINNPGMII